MTTPCGASETTTVTIGVVTVPGWPSVFVTVVPGLGETTIRTKGKVPTAVVTYVVAGIVVVMTAGEVMTGLIAEGVPDKVVVLGPIGIPLDCVMVVTPGLTAVMVEVPVDPDKTVTTIGTV